MYDCPAGLKPVAACCSSVGVKYRDTTWMEHLPFFEHGSRSRAPFHTFARLSLSHTWRGISMPAAKGRRRRPSTRRRRLNRILLSIIGFCAVLIIIGAVAGSHGSKPGSPTAGASELTTASVNPSASSLASTESHPAAATTTAPPASPRTASQRPATARQSTPKPAPPPPSTTQPSAAPTGCYPLSDENTCYEPGEYCRDDDHGMTGVAGDGEKIVCEDNDGWRWEPY
jgi:hypothetical protein